MSQLDFTTLCEVYGFRRGVFEVCALRGCDVAHVDNLPMFWDSVSFAFTGIKQLPFTAPEITSGSPHLRADFLVVSGSHADFWTA